jgi:hypothetical protein
MEQAQMVIPIEVRSLLAIVQEFRRFRRFRRRVIECRKKAGASLTGNAPANRKRRGLFFYPERGEEAMSHHRRRRARRRQLFRMSPAPIFYAAVDAAEVRRCWPAHLLTECSETDCDVCRTKVMVHAPVFHHTRERAALAGCRVVVLCRQCTKDEGLFGGARPRVELRLTDPELQSRLQGWDTARN